MARIKIRHLVAKKSGAGTLYYWQPAAALKAAGWQAERLPDDLSAAVARAERLNAELDAWRAGTPLPAEPATPTAPQATRRTAPAIGPKLGTLGHIIALYKASRFYLDLRAKTKRSYIQNIELLAQWAGDAPVAAISAKRVQKLYDALRTNTPAKANAVVTMLRILLAHAVREGLVAQNAASRPGLISQAQSGRRWPREAVPLLIEAADKLGWHSVGTAILLAHWTGQRQGDVLSMRRTAWRDGAISLRQSKTAARVSIPENPALAARLAAELARQDARGAVSTHLLVCEGSGQPWKEDYFRHVFAAIRAKAADKWPAFLDEDDQAQPVDDLQFMWLRHTAVTDLAIAGCTALQIAGITGHTVKSVEQILSRYLVRTSEMAAEAVRKRSAYRDGE